MTYVVTETCIKCKYTDCVDVCPVDCFREGPNFLVIDPDECIDCTLCVAECPVEAIYAEDDVPDNQQEYTALNAELAKVWKPIIEKKDGPPDADEWAKVKEKKHLLEKSSEANASPDVRQLFSNPTVHHCRRCSRCRTKCRSACIVQTGKSCQWKKGALEWE